MPVFHLLLKFDGSDSKKATQQLDKLASSASKTEKAFDSLVQEVDKLQRTSGTAAESLEKIPASRGKIRGLGSDFDALAKKVAAVTAAYLSLSQLLQRVSVGFDYNDQLETSRLGIATVVAATLELADAQGKVLSGQEKFAAAQKMSVEMAKELDVASMQSPAGYTDLLSTFQQLLAPATQLGLSWQDTLDVTIRMSNVLSALGVDMANLGNETKAMLTGTRLSLSQVAKSLGVTSEEIKNWGSGQNFMENFEKRLEAFKYAGVAVENSMSAIRAYYDDVVSNVSADATIGLWQKWKEVLLAVADAFYKIDEETGKFRLDEDIEPLVQLLDQIGTSLGDTVLSGVREIMEALGSFGKYLGEKNPAVFFEELTDAVKVCAATFVTLRVTQKAVTADWEGLKKKLVDYLAKSKTVTTTTYANAAALRSLGTAGKSAAAGIAGLRGFMTLLGGPLGVALTAASVGMTYLATRQDAGERAAKSHAEALEILDNALKGATDQSGNLTRALTDLEKKELQIGINKLSQSLSLELEAMEDGVKDTVKDINSELRNIGLATEDPTDVDTTTLAQIKTLTEIRTALETLPGDFRKAKITAEEFHNAMLDLALTVRNAGFEDIAADIEKLATAEKNSSQSINNTTIAVEKKRDILNQANNTDASSVTIVQQQMQAEKELAAALEVARNSEGKNVDTVQGAIAWLTKRNNATKSGQEALKAHAKATDELALATLRLAETQQAAAAATAQATLASGTATEEQIASAQKTLALYAELQNAIKTFETNKGSFGIPISGGSSSTSSLKSAKESIERLREEIAQLNGEMGKAQGDITRKKDEIEKLGNAAHLSKEKIRQLKEEYEAAFRANTLKEFNKELLTLEDNTAALREVEIADTVAKWEQSFSAAGISADEAAPKIERLKKALTEQQEYKDLQTAANFFQELATLSGNYSTSTEFQNKLLEEQAKIFRKDLPDSMSPYVDEWLRLKQLQNSRDAWDGAKRAAQSFYADSINYAQQMEELTTSALDNMTDSFAEFCRTGKTDFASLVDSMIADLYRLAAKQAIGGIVGGLLGGVSSLFSGSSTANAVSSDTAISGLTNTLSNVSLFNAKGNVFSGGDLSSYRNSIVSSPTLFTHDQHVSRYASGAGLMGEAGPEAVMPLTRMSNGDLGVAVDMDGLTTSVAALTSLLSGSALSSTPGIASAPDTGSRITAQYLENISNHMDSFFEVNRQLAESRQSETPNISVNINNQTGAQVDAQSKVTSDGNGNYSLEILLSQVEQGLVTRARSGKSQLMQYQEKTYGMNRASVLARGRGRT